MNTVLTILQTSVWTTILVGAILLLFLPLDKVGEITANALLIVAIIEITVMVFYVLSVFCN